MTARDFRSAGVGETPDPVGRLTRAFTDLRAIFDVGTALLLADAGFGVVGWAPVMDAGVAS